MFTLMEDLQQAGTYMFNECKAFTLLTQINLCVVTLEHTLDFTTRVGSYCDFKRSINAKSHAY